MLLKNINVLISVLEIKENVVVISSKEVSPIISRNFVLVGHVSTQFYSKMPSYEKSVKK